MIVYHIILFIKVLKSLGQNYGAKNVVAHFLPILFIKGLKFLRQLFGAKNVVARFLPSFLLFIYIFRKCLLDKIIAKNVVAHFLRNFFSSVYS